MSAPLTFFFSLQFIASLAGCTSDAGSAEPENDGADICAAADSAWAEFSRDENNVACATDEDCTVVGDCGPHSEWFALRVGTETEGQRLWNARCAPEIPAWDGYLSEAVCMAGQCQLIASVALCGAPPTSDASTSDADM